MEVLLLGVWYLAGMVGFILGEYWFSDERTLNLEYELTLGKVLFGLFLSFSGGLCLVMILGMKVNACSKVLYTFKRKEK